MPLPTYDELVAEELPSYDEVTASLPSYDELVAEKGDSPALKQSLAIDEGEAISPETAGKTVRSVLNFPGKVVAAASDIFNPAGPVLPRWRSDEEVEKGIISPGAIKRTLTSPLVTLPIEPGAAADSVMAIPAKVMTAASDMTPSAAPRMPRWISDEQAMKTSGGVSSGLIDAASGFTSPSNLALLPLGAGKTASKVLAGVFAAQAAQHFPDQWKAFNEAEDEGEKAKIATEVLVGLGLPVAAFLHGKGKSEEGPGKGRSGEAETAGETLGKSDEPAPSTPIEGSVQEPVRTAVDEQSSGLKEAVPESVEPTGQKDVTLQFEKDIPLQQEEGSIQRFGIIDREGKRLGSVDIEPKDGGKTLEIVWAGGESKELFGQLGPAKVRQLLSDVRQAFPNAERLTGARPRGREADFVLPEKASSVPNAPENQPVAPGIPKSEPTSTKNATTTSEREARGIPAAEEGRGISKIGKSIEAKAVEAKLTQGFAETAGYDPITIQDQAQRATGLVKSSLPQARAVIRGEQPLPEGLRGTALITAMEEHILKNPSAELAHELANSPLTSATSAAAQEMRLMSERVPDGITAAFHEIREARKAGSKQRGQTKERIIQEVRREVVRNSSKRPTWEAFVRDITCA